MQEKKVSFGRILGCIAPLLLVFAIQISVSFVGGIYLYISEMINSNGKTLEEITANIENKVLDNSFLLLLTAISGIISFIVFGIWYRNLKKKEPKTSKVVKSKDILSIIGLGLSFQFGITLILQLLYYVIPNTMDKYNTHIQTFEIGETLVSTLLVMFIAPFYEDMIFRGVTLFKGMQMTKFMYANIIQALMFGVFHGNIVQGTYAFAMGLVLGYVYYKYERIWMAIFLHFVVNASGILLTLITQKMSETVYTYFNLISGGIGLVGSIVLLTSLVKGNHVEVKNEI